MLVNKYPDEESLQISEVMSAIPHAQFTQHSTPQLDSHLIVGKDLHNVNDTRLATARDQGLLVLNSCFFLMISLARFPWRSAHTLYKKYFFLFPYKYQFNTIFMKMV